jgi:2-polyprenyl-6-methoxyphenol hydroxylase-like FAD-dependent oxidoreductase
MTPRYSFDVAVIGGALVGAAIAALLDTTPRGRVRQALPQPVPTLSKP